MTQEDFFKRYTYSPSRDRIGGGGFGTVYRAKDNLLHRTVAIKVSEVKTTADGQKTFSLKDEFEALNHVPKHPNIANYEEFYSYESPQGLFDYAVMQFYPDGNLSNAIKHGLSDEQKEDIAIQLLEGIAFLHQHKVVHRDLKPGNILIVKDGNRIIPLITDFGLSKAAGVVDGSVFSNSFGAGTPKYSSPEQLQGKPLRFNTDLWSYGAILYELFTGTQLFSVGSGAANTAQADLEIYNKIVNGDVRGLNKMPEKWRKVAERCLVLDATKRAKDAVELFSLIGSDVDNDDTEVTVSPSTVTESHSPSASIRSMGGQNNQKDSSEKTKTRSGLWLGLGFGVVAVVILLSLFHKPNQIDSDTQTYEACQTVEDYRAYIAQFGSDAKHYADAKSFIDQYVADSTEQALQAQQQAEEKKKGTKKPKKTADPIASTALSVSGSYNGHDYVDLGLPSGTLWATCNIGANKPEGYGNYYAWGETSTKSVYDWDTYKYRFTKGDYINLTKYCNKLGYGNNGFTDNLTILQSGDDPATTNWGSSWQTPSKAQWDELLACTTNKWTTKNGVKGRLFISQKNAQTLFLPAAGVRWDSKVYNIGVGAYYWSSSLDTDSPDQSWKLFFFSDDCGMNHDHRYSGFAIRPVRKKTVPIGA